MKRVIALVLAAILLLGCLAGCGGAEEADEEIALAISYGLVPEELQGDYDNTISFRQYTELLTRLITMWDADKLPEWQEITAAAANSDEAMRREDGILEMAYALVLMGHGEPVDTDGDVNAAQQAIDGYGLSWNYPLFPTWEDMGFPWCRSNYMWGGLQMCTVHQSLVSGKAIYPFAPEGNSEYLKSPLTRADAIRAVLRFGETDPAAFEPEAVYLKVHDVGTYDKSIITDELLAAPSDLPEVTQEKLPSQWKGTGLTANKDGRHVMRDYSESDVIFLSENGFNFMRLFLGFSTLRFPDYPADLSLVNENELKDLDRLLAWCMQYGVHLQISMIDTPNGEESFNIGQEEWDNIHAYWAALARRYADIPAKYLSFDFVNEIEPSEENFDFAEENIQQIMADMKASNPSRVLLYSYHSNGNLTWVESMAKLGFAIGCHPYYPHYLNAGDYAFEEKNPYARPSWPQLWLPRMQFNCGQTPLVLQGAVAGATVSVYVSSVGEKGGGLAAYADGMEIASAFIERARPDELFTFTVPEGTKKLEVWVTDQGDHYAEADTIIIESAGKQTVLVPHDVLDYPDWSKPLPLVVREDGTVTNSEERWIDGEAVYDKRIAPMKEITDRYGVGFMVNEFGSYAVNVDWDIDLVVRFHDDMVAMLEAHDLPWTYCELYNHVPKHIITIDGKLSQWAGATNEQQTYGGVTYNVCKELLDVFRKYTMK